MKYSYHGSHLNITATLTEEATGITRAAESTETAIVPYRVKLNFYEGTPRFFKPGLPFYGQVSNRCNNNDKKRQNERKHRNK